MNNQDDNTNAQVKQPLFQKILSAQLKPVSFFFDFRQYG